MAQKVIKVRNKVKYDTEANWTKSDPVLLAGELAVSSDRNNRIKVGDGTKKWSELSFSGLKVGSNITLENDTISITKSNVTSALGYTPPTTNTTYNDATQSAHGLMTAADKKKLDGIASGANAYTHPSATAYASGLYKITTNNLGHVTAATAVTKSDITALGIPGQDTNTVYTHPSYTAKASGLYKVTVDDKGHVSAATAVTKSDITALGIPGQDTNTTYNDATQSTHGLMTAADKKKLDGIASGANKITVDSSMSTSSTNPVQNKVIKTELDKKMNIEATELTKEDLNDIRTYGFYFGGGSNTVTNKPEGIDAFGLHVYRSASGYLIQELTGANINDRSKYIRQYNGNTWTTWLTEAIFSDTPVDGKIVVTDGTEGKVKSSSYTIASSVPANAKFTDTVYTHPNYTAKASGLYKVTVDDKGHVSAATAVTKGDITALGIPSSNTDTHYTTGLKVGASATATANAAATNGNVFLNVMDNTTIRDSHKVVGSGATSVTSDANGNITISSSNTTYNDVSQSAHGLMTAADKKKLDGIASGANAYTHPSATAYASGLYKITTNALGHVTAATAVTKSDITALGIPGQDTNTTYNDATQSAHGLMTAADKKKLDGIASGANAYTHPSATAYASGLYKITTNALGHVTAATAVTKSDITALGIPGQDTNTVYTHPSYTAKASGLYKVTVDDKGHVSAATAVAKNDITALGIPGQDTNTWRGVQDNLSSDATDQSLSAYQGKVLKGLVDAKLPLSGGKLTGRLEKSAGQFVYQTSGESGKSGYVKLATFTIGQSYTNVPIEFTFCRRSDLAPTRVSISWGSTDSKDPTLAGLKVNGVTKDVWIVKSAESVWDLYVLKTEAWDTITVVEYYSPPYMSNVKVVWGNSLITTLPTTNITQASYGYNVGYASSAGSANAVSWANVSGKSNASQSVAGLMSSDDKKKLDGIASGANAYSHPTSTAYSSGLYKITTNNLGHVTSATAVTKSDITALGIPGQDTNTVYTHPSYTAKASGLYKVTVDDKGHVSATAAVTKSDITALGIPGQDTNTTYNDATQSAHGLMTAADKKKLDGIASGANAYTHPTATAYASGLYKITTNSLGHVTSATAVTKSDITALGIPGQDTNTVYTHPTYTSKSSGLYKITVDGTGHVSGASAVTKADITALGIPGQDTNTTYNDATQSTHGLMSISDKKKLDNISSNSQNTVYSSTQPSGQAIGDFWVKLEG